MRGAPKRTEASTAKPLAVIAREGENSVKPKPNPIVGSNATEAAVDNNADQVPNNGRTIDALDATKEREAEPTVTQPTIPFAVNEGAGTSGLGS